MYDILTFAQGPAKDISYKDLPKWICDEYHAVFFNQDLFKVYGILLRHFIEAVQSDSIKYSLFFFQVFTGPTSRNTPVKHNFASPIHAFGFMVNPQTFHGNEICMRIEIYGKGTIAPASN